MLEYNTEVLLGADKISHFCTFAVISFCASLMVLMITSKEFRLIGLSIIWFILIMIGVLEEYRQYALPNRTAELWDAVANLIGVTAGILLPFLFSMRRDTKPVARYFLFFLIILFPFILGLAELNERHFIVWNK
ncbi:VanZ family protein [Bacillus sp. Marseille-P3661]|uniref:VanZ family protein n=1 Tax=Bacillus sp. Marseille-P3661 TaxID=1936234 RepID=UPI000C863432|nr:VanZ family protein [Bacillus sp. Marseille-P3661]